MPERLDRVKKLLKARGLEKEYRKYLFTPQNISLIIRITNEGRIDEAISFTQKMEQLLYVLKDDLCPSDYDWYVDVVNIIKNAIASSQNKNRIL